MRTQISNLFSTRSPLVRKQEGASAVEYGLILGLIAVAIVTILRMDERRGIAAAIAWQASETRS